MVDYALTTIENVFQACGHAYVNALIRIHHLAEKLNKIWQNRLSDAVNMTGHATTTKMVMTLMNTHNLATLSVE